MIGSLCLYLPGQWGTWFRGLHYSYQEPESPMSLPLLHETFCFECLKGEMFLRSLRHLWTLCARTVGHRLPKHFGAFENVTILRAAVPIGINGFRSSQCPSDHRNELLQFFACQSQRCDTASHRVLAAGSKFNSKTCHRSWKFRGHPECSKIYAAFLLKNCAHAHTHTPPN